MTDRITPERVKELRKTIDRWEFEMNSVGEWELSDRQDKIDLLALLSATPMMAEGLDQPAPPTSGERQKLLTRLDVMNNHYKDTMFHGDWPVLGVKVHNAEVGAIRSLILSAPKTVTREWVGAWAKAVWKGNSCIEGNIYAMLRELGITVEDKSEGEDE